MNKTGRIGKGPAHLAVTAQLASAVTGQPRRITYWISTVLTARSWSS